jgi:hypothetical protein
LRLTLSIESRLPQAKLMFSFVLIAIKSYFSRKGCSQFENTPSTPTRHSNIP